MGYQPAPLTTYAETHTWHRYDKCFSYIPTKCYDSNWVWLKNYYKKYLVYSYNQIPDVSYFICNLTAGDATIEKLTE